MRSEDMTYVQIFIPFEQAFHTLLFVGEHALIQFIDLNKPATDLFYNHHLLRVNKMLKSINYLHSKLKQYHITINHQNDEDTPTINNLESMLNKHSDRAIELINNYECLLSNKTNLENELQTIQYYNEIIDYEENNFCINEIAVDLEEGKSNTINNNLEQLEYIAGLVSVDKIFAIEKLLFRMSRGNLIFKSKPISSDECIFIIVVHGLLFKDKVVKTMLLMDAVLYKVSKPEKSKHEYIDSLALKIKDLNDVLNDSKLAMDHELNLIGNEIQAWSLAANKQKHVYQCLNKFNYDDKRRCLIAEGWCHTLAISKIQNIFKNVADSTMSSMPSCLNIIETSKQPPTYNITNKFTNGFQEIVNSYGVAKYGEVNPGLFTTISFPFLFAVMFGDFGHGCIMLVIALYLVIKEKKLSKIKGEMFNMIFNGRYILLLMAIFSMFTGMIYNDIFSRSVPIFKSGWSWANNNTVASQSGVYPFGLDPAWHGAENSLIFTNSYKMKMSVIFGVVQMSFGVILTVVNYKHFKQTYSIFLEFIPQFLFLQCIFGYLCFCILFKWSVDWFAIDANGNNIYNNPPGLLNMLIYMFLQPGTISPSEQLYNGQGLVQLVLLIIVFCCVPIMLLGKPLYLKYMNYKKTKAANNNEDPGNTNTLEKDGQNEDKKGFDFSELMIHQMIHTIEFCLGCISNTASYLRLWALSLAHSQLSIVLWDMTISKALGIKGVLMPVVLVVVVVLWFALTISILLIMEGLSAFLHALRLHWVEFNNKFYHGTGTKFTPFYFDKLIQNDYN